jgi:hypothetical protein
LSVVYNRQNVNKCSSFGKKKLTKAFCGAILKFDFRFRHTMIDKDGLDQILNFVSKRWIELSRDPANKALQNLPSDFWMNSVGGKAGEKGHWMTMLLYTENEQDAAALKEVLLRWQSKGSTPKTDLIQIKRK